MKNEEVTDMQWYLIIPLLFQHESKTKLLFRNKTKNSQVIDPWGKVVAECDKDDVSVPQCRTATISLDGLTNIRKRLPCFEHRRNDVYALAAIEMIPSDKSVEKLNSNVTPIAVEDETTAPFFLFEKYPVPKSSTFLETPLSIGKIFGIVFSFHLMEFNLNFFSISFYKYSLCCARP